MNAKEFDPALLLEELTGLKSFVTRNRNCEDELGPEVISVTLSEESHPDPGPLFEMVTEAFDGKGFVVFMGDLVDGSAPLCVAPGESKMDILRAAFTEDVNGGLATEDIIQVLLEIDQLSHFEILGAASDSALLLFTLPVAHLETVSAMLFSLCNDLISELSNDLTDEELEAMSAPEIVAHRLCSEEPFIPLWWD